MTRKQAACTRRQAASLGGLTVKQKMPPESCPRCGRSMIGRKWHSYLGHKGLHGLADKYFDGDIKAAQRHLQRNGLARQDPICGNGAWPRYVPVAEIKTRKVEGTREMVLEGVIKSMSYQSTTE